MPPYPQIDMTARSDTDSVIHRLLAVCQVVLVAFWTVFWTMLALMIHLVTRSHAVAT